MKKKILLFVFVLCAFILNAPFALALDAGIGREAVSATPVSVWIFLVAAGLIGIFVTVRALSGLHRTVQADPSYELPEDLSSAQAGFLIDGEADDRDLLSLILGFAQKGFLTLSCDEWDGSDPDQMPLVLTKRRDLPSNAPEFERTIFSALFPDGQNIFHLTHPDDRFSSSLEKAKEQLEDSFSGEHRLYQSQTMLHSLLFPFAGCLLLFLGLSRVGIGPSLAACIPLAMLSFWMHMVFRRWRFLQTSSRVAWGIGGAVLALLAGGGSVLAMWSTSTPLWLTIPVFALVLAACLLAPLVARPTAYHTKASQRLLALFTFLENPPKEQLPHLLEENPDYFYSALPYAYVFGLADEWACAFESLCKHAPLWYTNGYQDFSTSSFVSSFRYSVETALAKNDEQ